MLTDFGKALRKMRIDRGEVLKHMADKLGWTSSYLSAIEVGKRVIPEDLIERLATLYELTQPAIAELREAEQRSAKQIKLHLEGTFGIKKEAAILFARSFETMDEQTASDVLKILNEQKNRR
jgi:hypothetical protein